MKILKLKWIAMLYFRNFMQWKNLYQTNSFAIKIVVYLKEITVESVSLKKSPEKNQGSFCF